jgi:hypothetical protein
MYITCGRQRNQKFQVMIITKHYIPEEVLDYTRKLLQFYNK